MTITATPDQIVQALQDPRVVRTLEIALRDVQIRVRVRELAQQMSIVAACEVVGEEYFLSADRVNAIVYGSGR